MSGLSLDEIKANARPMLVRLALVSHAPAGRMDAMPRTHGTPEHRRPPGEAHPEAERLAHRLAETLSRSEALAIVDEIRVELERATRRTMATSAIETREELDERIVEAVGWPVDLVAAAMRCPESWVRSARVAVGRDPETGFMPPDGDPMAVAAVLVEQGRSLYTVARLTGIPRSTLRYRLGMP